VQTTLVDNHDQNLGESGEYASLLMSGQQLVVFIYIMWRLESIINPVFSQVFGGKL